MKNTRPSSAPVLALLVPGILSLGLLGLGALFPAGEAHADLALDTTFDTDGIAQVDVAAGPDAARDVAVQLDGALVLAGRSRQTSGGSTIDYVTVTRLDALAGVPDATFGTGGTVTFLPGLSATNGGGGDGQALVIQPLDQKILVAGTWKASAAAASEVFVARFDTSGVLDGTFGTGGVVLLTPASVTNPAGNAIALRSDGSIIVAGTGTAASESVGFVTGLTSAGLPIPGFTDGIVQNPLVTGGASFGFNDVAVLAGDGILAGGGGGDLTLAQFTSTGAPDTAFDADGIASFNFLTFSTATGPNPSFDVITAIKVLGDGRILFTGRAGSTATSTATNRVLGRASAAGVLDATFGSGGYAPLVDASTEEVPQGLGVRPSGDIVLVGQGFTPTQISANGIAVIGITGTFNPVLADLEVLGDGNVVAAGTRTVSGANTAIAAARIIATDLADGPDTVPDPFPFTTQTGLEPGFIATSNTVTISGIDAPAVISVSSGDLYAIGCVAPFVTASGTITNGQTVCVRTDAAQADITAKSAFLIIGGVVSQFTLVTGDATPDQFSFVDQTGVAASTAITSAPITLAGLTTRTDVGITGAGSYSAGCTATYTTQTTTVDPGTEICVRHTSAAATGGIVTTTLVTGINTIIQDTFTTTTGVDTSPDPIAFVDQTDVALGAVITSASVTISGIDSPAPISVTGGEYSIGCTAAFTASASTVPPDSTVCVRHTSSAVGGGTVNTTLTVGAGNPVSDTFTSTAAGDTTPDNFSFVDQPGVAKSTVITSAAVSLAGFTSNAPISVSGAGGTYSIGCSGTFTAVAGTVSPGSTVCVRHTSSAAGGTAVNTTLSVGGVTDVFTSTTAGAPDTTPDQFTFVDQTGVPLAAVITSSVISIGGFDTNATVSITGGTYSVNCGANFTAGTGTLAPNTLICVRHTSESTGGAVKSTTLTVGGVSDTFTSTTLAGDAVPAAFTFTDQTGVDLFATITSAPVTITGIDIASPVTVANGEYSIGCTSTFTTAQSNITSGQTVCVRHESSFNSADSVETTLTIGTVSATFTSTTRVGDQLPDNFSFASKTGVAKSTVVRSETITISGVDSPVAIFVSGGSSNVGFAKDCGDTVGQSGDILDPGDELCLIAISPAVDNTSLVLTLTIGGSDPGNQNSATFTITTGETVPDDFTFTDQVGVPTLSTVYAAPITITGITAPSKVEISQNGQYQINCEGNFTGNDGVVEDGDTICVRHVSSGSLSSLTNTVLTVGGISDTFTSTTTADSTPLPGSSSMDALSLLLLAPLAGYRRRRRAA